jgi:hypothetical protein
MPSLLDLQRDLAHCLLDAGAEASRWIMADGIAGGDRLAIHRNTFAGTIVGALRITYPAVEKLVGAEFFEAAARIHLQQDPPRSAYLNDYGEGFARFLASFPPAASLSYLPDVAALEWAVARAANAPDAAHLDLAALAGIDPPMLERVSLAPHPSVQLIEVRYAADLIWHAVLNHDEAALAAIRPTDDRIALLVYRNHAGAGLRRLSPAESRAAARLFIGLSLAECFTDMDPAAVTALLSHLLSDGVFSEIRLGASTETSQASGTAS